MAMFGTSAVEDKNKEIAQIKKDYETEKRHKTEIDTLKEAQRNETQAFKERVLDLEIRAERADSMRSNTEEQLKYERENRKTLVDAEVQKQLGAYEVRYYHDLHTFMENHNEKTQERMMKYMDNTLSAIKELKPVEPKVFLVDKAGSTEAGKQKQQEKQS